MTVLYRHKHSWVAALLLTVREMQGIEERDVSKLISNPNRLLSIIRFLTTYRLSEEGSGLQSARLTDSNFREIEQAEQTPYDSEFGVAKSFFHHGA